MTASRPLRAPAFVLIAVLLAIFLLCASGRQLAAQLDAFSYDRAKVPVGRVFEYVKSNRDGTHAARITVYVAGPDRLESFKWDSGGSQATLVVAHIDWQRFSVRRFESWRIARGRPKALVAILETDSAGRGIRFSLAPDTLITITAWPWHSYDFDFASLGLTLPHLRAPEARFRFQRADVIHGEDRLAFGDFGPVEVGFVGREVRGRRAWLTGSVGHPTRENSQPGRSRIAPAKLGT